MHCCNYIPCIILPTEGILHSRSIIQTEARIQVSASHLTLLLHEAQTDEML